MTTKFVHFEINRKNSRPPTNRGQSYIFKCPPRSHGPGYGEVLLQPSTSSIPRQVGTLNVPVGQLEDCNLLVLHNYTPFICAGT